MRTGAREGLELVCPFCRKSVDRPGVIQVDAVEQALGGTCRTCGAVYLVDETSKNLGEVMMQALGIAARRVAKEPTDLVSGEDYEDIVLDYDWRTHRSSGEARGFMNRRGRLYVIKLKKDQAPTEAP